MGITTDLPTPPSTSDPADFQAQADAFMAGLRLFQTELNAYAASLSPLGRNMLINGGFDLNQRALASVSDDAYCFDRWYALTQSGAIAPSQLGPAIESGYNQAMRLTQSQASAQRFGFAQIVENANCVHARGGSGTLSGRVRCSASTTIRYAILGWTGTADTVTSDVVNNWASGAFTAGNFFLASSVAVLATGSQAVVANTWTGLAALTASLGTSFNNIVIMVWTDSTQAQNVTLDCDFVQFEAGANATPFEKRSIGHEKTLANQYCRKFGSGSLNDAFMMSNSYSTTQCEGVMTYEEMRGVPTVTIQNQTDFLVYSGTHGGPYVCTSTTAAQATKRSLRFSNVIGSASLTAGQVVAIISSTGVAAVLLEAEL